MNRVTIKIEGGIVQDITANEQVEVNVLDYDIEGLAYDAEDNLKYGYYEDESGIPYRHSTYEVPGGCKHRYEVGVQITHSDIMYVDATSADEAERIAEETYDANGLEMSDADVDAVDVRPVIGDN